MHRLFKRLLFNGEPLQPTQVRPRSMILPGEWGLACGKNAPGMEGSNPGCPPGGPQPTTAVQASRFSAGAQQIREFPVGWWARSF